MRKIIILLITVLFAFSVNAQKLTKQYTFNTNNKVNSHKVYQEFINNHKYSKSEHLTKEELKKIPKDDRPDLAWQQDFLMTLDPALGYVPHERKIQALKFAEQKLSQKTAIPGVNWTERGPNNVGGRTRALMYDPNDAANGYKKVWAGGITGGLWYNSDITDANSSWVRINDFWANIAVSCIEYDPNNTNTFYVGTGEGWGTGAGMGAGIWKTTDGGVSWNRLTSTDNSDFYYVQKIKITSTGRVIVATSTNLKISDDGGANWTDKISGFFADVEIAANGDIYASKGRINQAGSVHKSSDGGNNFSDITPSGGSPERIELACAPSNTNIVYAVASNGRNVEWFKKSTNGGTSWSDITIPNYMEQTCSYGSQDFTRGQAWYDLILSVKPDNANVVLVGGIDIHKSTNGGTSWDCISYWTGACFDMVHADQHAMAFNPNNYNEAIFGCDGGVYYSTDVGNSSSPTFDPRLKDYNVTQFYSCAIKNSGAANFYLAGSQDNGSHRFNTVGMNSTVAVSGGDGAFCFIDQDDDTYQITSYVYNNWYRSTNGGNSFSGITSNNDGRFINPADYDNSADILYCANNSNELYVVSGISGTISTNVRTVQGDALGGGTASSITASPYSANTLFVGTGSGSIFKITNSSVNPTSTNIDPSGTLPSGYLSCIEIGANDNQLLVTFTNYGLTSVWETQDGGTNWRDIEGNLPDMPVRWALYNPNNLNQVMLATEVGVWTTTDISVASPDWDPSSTGLANVRCDMLQIRSSDYQVVVGTHGRGLFTTDIFSSPLPVAEFQANKTRGCLSDTFKITDFSSQNPTIWTWTITPATYNFVNGTTSSSQNPELIFTAAGNYTISLDVDNGVGTDNETKNNYIEISTICSYPIHDGTVYTCDGYFYDTGYETQDYQNNEDYIMTFYPSITGNKLEFNFTAYNVENETNCAYDYLKIYDGENTSAPQIGSKYCGTNSPGTITATSATGAITFEWHADGGVVDNGWEATIQCIGASAPVAEFNSDITTSCNGSINFFDQTTNAPNNWQWDFGDSNSSNLQNPTHTYATSGTYTVTLIASSAQGSDTITKVNYITVNFPTAPTTTDGDRCGSGIVLLTASGSGTLEWYDSASAGTLVNTGAGFATPYLTSTTTYYVENHESQQSQFSNPSDNTFGGGSYYANSTSHYLVFDAISEFELISVKVYANGAGNRTITLRDDGGLTINSTTVNFPDGESRITLNWTVPIGTDYELSLNGNPDVYRNYNGASFPYTLPNVLTITGTSYSNTGYYYYFYDWEVSAGNCVSSRTPVTATINQPDTPAVSITATDTSICVGDNVTFTATPTNGGTPTYQWYLNGNPVGSNSLTYDNSSLSNNDVITCEMTSSLACTSSATATSNSITMNVGSPTNTAVSIAESANNICAGTSVTFTATPTNGGTPAYQWYVNSNPVGTNSSTYNNSTLANSDTISCEMTSSLACPIPATVASNNITMTVNPVNNTSVSIAESGNNICAGTSVTFTATPTNGGTPTYQWYLNSNPVGSNLSTYDNSSLTNGDTISCEMSSSIACSNPATATSNNITMVVNPVLNTLVSIAESANNICAGTSVTFTATPTNGGTPIYQWHLNGSLVGSNSATYLNSSLADGDVVLCEMTSSVACPNPATATSNNITMVVNPTINTSVSIAESANNICAGTSVTFTASPTNGGTPTYQWYLNSNPVGSNLASYSNSSLVNGDVVSCEMTSSISCPSPATASSNNITMAVNPVLATLVNISESANNVCIGDNITFIATPTNGGTPTYQWYINSNPVGSNSANYASSTLADGDIVSCQMTSSVTCPNPATASSNNITMILNNSLTPDVSIAESANNVCIGDTIKFTATPTNGGTPTYQWYLNSNTVGSNSSIYSNSGLSNNDVVYCQMTSSLSCANPTSDNSNNVTIIVNPTINPTVSIAESANNICDGDNVNFNATPTNGGTPIYQWYLNSNPVGSNSASYANSALANGDVVSCEMTSSLACTSPTTASSNNVSMIVNPLITPTVSINANNMVVCAGDNVNFTATSTNGGTPTYQWYLNSNPVGSNLASYNNSTLANSDVVSCEMTSSLSCTSPTTATSNNLTLTVNPILNPTVSVMESINNICIGDTITFTATPTDGGTPTYQWYVNSTSVGTNSANYSDFTLSDGDVVSCEMTSSLACTNPTTATSNNVNIVVNPTTNPAVAISESTDTICFGAMVTFTATPTDGGTPIYQWYVNSTAVGSNSPTYDNSTLTTSDVVSCQMTSSLACTSVNPAISNNLSIMVNAITNPAVAISESTDTICYGDLVTFTATPTDGGTPTYQWYVNSTSVGTNSVNYSDFTLSDGDVVSCEMTSSLACTNPTTAISNNVNIVVNPTTNPAVAISESTDTICYGDMVTYTATPTDGGTPIYQWYVNSTAVGSNFPTYDNSTLTTSDVVSCQMTSSLACTSVNPAISNNLSIMVNAITNPAVAISESTDTICYGDMVTFTATPTDGGIPTYQWYVNSNTVGTNSPTYDNSTLNSSDVVSCQMTSSLACASVNPAISNNLSILVNPIPSSPVGTDEHSCYGGAISDLSASGTNINWYSDANLSTLVNNGNTYSTGETAGGVYTYYITQTINNCESPASAVNLTITHSTTPQVDYDWVCTSGSATLTANGNGTFNWYDAPTGGTLLYTGNPFTTPMVSQTTNFYVERILNGCVSANRALGLAIVYYVPTANFTYVQDSLTVDFTNTSTNADTYFWDFNDYNATSISFNPTHVFSHHQYFDVMLIATNECYTDTFIKQINLNMIGISSNNYNNSIAIYPNPASTYIQVESGDLEIESYAIYDVAGRNLTAVNSVKFSKADRVDITNLPKGIYFIKVQTDNGVFVGKFVKE